MRKRKMHDICFVITSCLGRGKNFAILILSSLKSRSIDSNFKYHTRRSCSQSYFGIVI